MLLSSSVALRIAIDFQLQVNIDDGFLNLMTNDGTPKDDVKVPEGDLGKQIQDNFDEGKEVLVTIVSAMGEEAAISSKEAPKGLTGVLILLCFSCIHLYVNVFLLTSLSCRLEQLITVVVVCSYSYERCSIAMYEEQLNSCV
jgi:hypothetical protein